MTINGINGINRIERRRRPLYSAFSREFLAPRKPVVITGALDIWGALARWTPQFLQRSLWCYPVVCG